jgi:hypothetical protein
MPRRLEGQSSLISAYNFEYKYLFYTPHLHRIPEELVFKNTHVNIVIEVSGNALGLHTLIMHPFRLQDAI